MFALALVILAHVTANPNMGPANGYLVTYFRIGHACNSTEKTKSVEIEIPSQINSVRAKNTMGWTFELTKEPLATPITSGESIIKERISKVVYTSTAGLDDGAFEDLGLSFKLPDAAGTNLFFKTTQKCDTLTNAWVNIPENNDVSKWGATAKPAPYVMVQAASSATSTSAIEAPKDQTAMAIGVAGTFYLFRSSCWCSSIVSRCSFGYKEQKISLNKSCQIFNSNPTSQESTIETTTHILESLVVYVSFEIVLIVV